MLPSSEHPVWHQLSQLWATDSSCRAGSGTSPVSIMGQLRTVWAKNNRSSDERLNKVTDFRWTNSLSFWLFTACLAPSFPAALRKCRCCRVCTYDIEGKGNEAVVSAQDTERLLPLHQRKEVVCHRLTIEEVVDTKKKVPVRIKESSQSDEAFSTDEAKSVTMFKLLFAPGCLRSTTLHRNHHYS